MGLLTQMNVELFRTDTMGNIVLVTDGDTMAVFLEICDTQFTGYDKAA